MLLYKYMPTSRFFTNFKLRFTPAEDLNDPQELVPDIRLLNPGNYMRDITQRNFGRFYFQFLLDNPSMSPAEAMARCLSAAQQLEQQFDESAKVLEIYEMFMRTTNKHIGVLSLSEDPCNTPMWAHYADEYKGLALGFDSESAFFQPKPEEPRPCGQLMNVVYTDTSPVVYVEPGKIEYPKEVFFTKATRWQYEKEWRVIKHLPQASTIASGPGGKPIHLFDVPPETIKEVVFGYKVTPEFRAEVERALDERAPHVVRKQVKFVPPKNLVLVDC